MKKFAIAAFAMLAAPSLAQVYVPGYTRSDGTYVQGHQRSAPDSNPYNNYSAQGNVNPYTGRVGTVSPNQGYRNNSVVNQLGQRKRTGGF